MLHSERSGELFGRAPRRGAFLFLVSLDLLRGVVYRHDICTGGKNYKEGRLFAKFFRYQAQRFCPATGFPIRLTCSGRKARPGARAFKLEVSLLHTC
jgi:hypothetical protein